MKRAILVAFSIMFGVATFAHAEGDAAQDAAKPAEATATDAGGNAAAAEPEKKDEEKKDDAAAPAPAAQ